MKVPLLISYAQNFEDVILSRALSGVKKGFYVDVGAWDPVEDSVTKSFYDRGWRGINIEPNPEYFVHLANARPKDINLDIAVSGASGTAKLYAVKGTGLSTFDAKVAKQHKKSHGYIVEEIEVSIRPLDDILAEHAPAEIHFLKIDAEGSEKSILDGLNLKIFRPWIILVEAVEPTRKAQSWGWEPLITKSGYRFCYFDGLNRFYVADEHADISDRLAIPPNVFDEIVLARELKFEQRIESARAEVQAHWSKIEQLSKENSAFFENDAKQRDELFTLNATITSLREELALTVKAHRTETERLLSENKKLAELNRTHRTEIDQFSRKNSELAEKAAERKEAIFNLNETVASLQKELALANAETWANWERVEALSAELNALFEQACRSRAETLALGARLRSIEGAAQ